MLSGGDMVFMNSIRCPVNSRVDLAKLKVIISKKTKKIHIEKAKNRSKKAKNFFGIADQKRQKPQRTSSKIY